ncbi:hypothetical protein F8388_023496 [Cannabis sativa]|uniref:Uncharacterized protein n=1 Tax=Cannabis sativa TaxID=3483 RepID=A0A7J6GLK2_CANSA|nr:hypothetical protein F8388_023496 [Cannabis sativa]
MYGDCQVMSSMGGNVVSSETLFSSPIQNPNFNFISTMPYQPFSTILPKEEHSLLHRGKDEMLESGSGSEQMEEKSGNEQENSSDQLLLQQQGKKKRYHRHTARQIQEMEALFKECPHPDDKQRMKLSQDLGLKPRQVKFWFQNRRTQMKAQQDRNDNQILRAENETLKNENFQLQAALRNASCPNCGSPAVMGEMGFDEQQLRLENARLREELDRYYCMTPRFSSRTIGGGPHHPLMPPSLDLDISIYSRHFPDQMATGNGHNMVPVVPMLPHQEPFPDNGLLLEEEKSLAIELATSSVNELVKMCQSGSPLWIRDSENGKEVLNVEEHARMFPWAMNLKQNNDSSGFKTEATRDTDVVIMNSITLIESFLDCSKWMDLFPSMVSRAKTLQVITTDASGQPINGSLQLVFAELQYLSPLVPTREAHFLRYCQQSPDQERTWFIVDFPVDSFHDILQYQPSLPRYRRRPSGCIIQDMPNGYSSVTWVEHAEIDQEKTVHQTFSHFVQSGMAFGAPRWLALLKRQCERIASLMARNITDLGVMHSTDARKNMMNLSQRMFRTFCVNISTSGGQLWTALSDNPEDTVRITTRKVTEPQPGQPNGLILSAVSTTFLPFPDYQVFNLLRDEGRRSQLEVLSNGNSLQKIDHIANGSDPGNCISLLRINVASNSAQPMELMLQESCTDKSGSVVVYSTMDVDAIKLAMQGKDPSFIPILPSGFVIVPVELASENNNATGNKSGCLLTIGLQVLASPDPTAKLSLPSVNAINNHLSNTIRQIMAALGSTAAATTCADNNGGSGSSSGVDHGTATTADGPSQ